VCSGFWWWGTGKTVELACRLVDCLGLVSALVPKFSPRGSPYQEDVFLSVAGVANSGDRSTVCGAGVGLSVGCHVDLVSRKFFFARRRTPQGDCKADKRGGQVPVQVQVVGRRAA
jgi:hypothetical protein